jgi:hypothetical protein
LLIEVESTSDLTKHIKIEKSQINKYGLKKIKFQFNLASGEDGVNVTVSILLNREVVSVFDLFVEGYSLKQRKKLLEADLNAKDKKYYK